MRLVAAVSPEKVHTHGPESPDCQLTSTKNFPNHNYGDHYTQSPIMTVSSAAYSKLRGFYFHTCVCMCSYVMLSSEAGAHTCYVRVLPLSHTLVLISPSSVYVRQVSISKKDISKQNKRIYYNNKYPFKSKNYWPSISWALIKMNFVKCNLQCYIG